jgi:hypothetical protein
MGPIASMLACASLASCGAAGHAGAAAMMSPVVQAPNFKGINVCMHVSPPHGVAGKPAPAGVDVRLTTRLGDADPVQRPASYEISAAGVGRITLREELAAPEACRQRPANQFGWVGVSERSARAELCLTGPRGTGMQVLVDAEAQSEPGRLSDTKAMLIGIAACRMKMFPSEYDAEDHYFDGEVLLLGPYVLAAE